MTRDWAAVGDGRAPALHESVDGGCCSPLASAHCSLGSSWRVAASLGRCRCCQTPSTRCRTRCSDRFAYGYRRNEVLGTLASIVLRWVLTAGLLMEAYGRIYAPKAIKALPMLYMSIAGVLVNGILIFVFGHEQRASNHWRSIMLCRSSFSSAYRLLLPPVADCRPDMHACFWHSSHFNHYRHTTRHFPRTDASHARPYLSRTSARADQQDQRRAKC